MSIIDLGEGGKGVDESDGKVFTLNPITTAFSRRSSGDGRGPRRQDGGTAGRRDGGTAGRRDDRLAGRWDGATVGRQYTGTAGRSLGEGGKGVDESDGKVNL